MTSTRTRALAPIIGLVVMFVLIAGLGIAVWSWVNHRIPLVSVPPAQQCLAAAAGTEASMDLEQSGNAAIIVAESIRRGLPARAATIALATAMQESSLRNLDHGDRDSVGLFQQRPSQGWGTVEQIMDPWYSSGQFYAHLVKVENWQTGDINDVAQAVQRSGVPDGYRKHVANAQVLASVLTGHSPAGLRCVDRTGATGQPAVVKALLQKGFAGRVGVSTGTAQTGSAAPGQALVVTAPDTTTLWAAVHLAMATIAESGITGVTVGGQTWTLSGSSFASWGGTATPSPTRAAITLRG